MKWKKQDRQLKDGDLLRCKVSNPEHEKYGKWVYGICSGSGFGCSISTMGNAIFMHYQDFDFQKVLTKKKIGEYDVSESTRWERFWGVEYAHFEDENKKSQGQQHFEIEQQLTEREDA